MGIKVKRNVFVGEKRGSCTPTTSWKIGLAHSDGSLVHVNNPNFPFINTLSARRLGADIKKTQTQIKAINMNKGDSGVGHFNHEKEECFELHSQMAEPPDDTEEQPPSASSLRRHIAATVFQQNRFVGINGHALQPVPLASPNSSLEVSPYYSAVTPASPLDFTDQGELSYNVKTSTELLKVLNRIWSLEEQHAGNLSLIKKLQRELEHSRAQIEKLLQEKKRLKEQVPTRKTVLSVRDELESERTLRKQSESLHRKLAQEVSQVKSSFSSSLEEIKRERKARVLLEDLCDEFAKGITDYEQKVRSLKHRPDEEFFSRERPDQLILHISESWLDERMQMKLAATPCGIPDKSTIAEKLSMEIESFLESKQPVVSGYVGGLSIKKVKKNSLRRYSLESFHLNDGASAPRNGDCEEDSSGTRMNGARDKNSIKSNPSRNKIQSRDVFKSNEYESSLQNQFQKYSCTTVTEKQKRAEYHDIYPDHVLHSISRNHSLPCTEDPLYHSSSSSHPTMKQEMLLGITTSKPEISQSSREGLQVIKKHSLKARLLEAKLESLMKNSKASIY